MITDDDLLAPVRQSLSRLHMQTPVETIIRAGRIRQRRRHAAVGTAATATGVAALIVGTSVTGGHAAPPVGSTGPLPVASTEPPPVGSPSTRPVAFTLTSAEGGATKLTLYKGQNLDPDALRQALAERGIPALVTVGKFCRTTPEPAPIGELLTPSEQAGENVFTINPAAIPPGAEISFGFVGNYVRFLLITENAPLQCNTGSQPAYHQTTRSATG